MLKIETIRCKICGKALREHVRSMTEHKKYKNHQGYDAY